MKWAIRILVVVAMVIGAAGLMSFSSWQGWTISTTDHAQLANRLSPNIQYYVPEGEGPFPTVLQFHGCGGPVGNQSDWGTLFAENGFAAIVVDSLSPRGIGRIEAISTVCTAMQLTSMERAGDILATLNLARDLPFVDSEQMFLAGWSHGGWSIMDLMTLDLALVSPPNLYAASPDDLAGVRGLILVYPYCGFPSQTLREGWRQDLPTIVIMGEDDIIAPARYCETALARLAEDGLHLESYLYENTGHDFDVTTREIFQRGIYLTEETERANTQVLDFLNRNSIR